MILAMATLIGATLSQEPTADALAQEALPHASPDLRYELGRRVRAMEEAFERASARERKAALEKIEESVSLFFSLNLPEAGRALDEAREALGGRSYDWRSSLCVTPHAWAVEPGEPVRITISQLYSHELPESIVLRFTIDGTRREVTQLPFTYEFGTLPEVPEEGWGKSQHFTVQFSDDRLGMDAGIVIIPHARDRARAAQALRGKRKDELPEWASRTTRLHLELLSSLLRDDGIETQLPGEDLLHTTERLLATDANELGQPGVLRHWVIGAEVVSALNTEAEQEQDVIVDRSHPFQQWIALPRANGRDVLRIYIPREVGEETAPLVVAMHGAGGSENMFIDGYGNGKITSLAQEHRAIVVSPKMDAGIDIEAMVDQLVPLLNVDRDQVYLLGHSMGAAAAIQAAQDAKRPYAGLLLLGGGRPVQPEGLPKMLGTPIYLAAGERDFALPGAMGLSRQLEGAEHSDFQFKIVPNTEHLTVVQVALDACFEWIVKRAK